MVCPLADWEIAEWVPGALTPGTQRFYRLEADDSITEVEPVCEYRDGSAVPTVVDWRPTV